MAGRVFKINSMIDTLGMMGILQAVCDDSEGSTARSKQPGRWFSMLGKGSRESRANYHLCGLHHYFKIVLKGRSLAGSLWLWAEQHRLPLYGGSMTKDCYDDFRVIGLMTAVAGVILGARVGAAQYGLARVMNLT